MHRAAPTTRSCAVIALSLLAVFVGCDFQRARSEPNGSIPVPEAELRHAMVERQIAARGISDPAVLAAMEAVPRHAFVPAAFQDLAYADGPLPIGQDQTISQPYIVALMTELLALKPGDKVLEVGTGSGYQAAVLAELTDQVYSIEILEDLGRQAETKLRELGYDRVQVRIGDGYQGWPDEAPFQGIIVTAAPPEIPAPLLEQLDPNGGRLVVPVGVGVQELLLVVRDGKRYVREAVIPVRFVPMTGEAQER